MLVLSRRVNEKKPLSPGTNPIVRVTSKRLRTASMELGLARLQLQTGDTEAAQNTLEQLHAELQRLRQRLDAESPRPAVGEGPAKRRQLAPAGLC